MRGDAYSCNSFPPAEDVDFDISSEEFERELSGIDKETIEHFGSFIVFNDNCEDKHGINIYFIKENTSVHLGIAEARLLAKIILHFIDRKD